MKNAFLALAATCVVGVGCLGDLSHESAPDNSEPSTTTVSDGTSSLRKSERTGDEPGASGDKEKGTPRFGRKAPRKKSQDLCGNGIVDDGEECDGNCPTVCDDGNSCTVDTLYGDATTCDAVCVIEEVSSCSSGDGCCPAGCTSEEDADCSDACGDGVTTPPELCDGNCSMDCDDGDACTTDAATGDPSSCNVQCSNSQITSCIADDGCCPTGCTSANDTDCSSYCGDGIVDAGETCDGSCPTTCDDGDRCTTDRLVGGSGTCDVACEFDAITSCRDGDGCCAPGCNSTNDDDCEASCGDGVLDAGETCDPPGSCPTSCNDGNACTTDRLLGSPSTCDARCSSAPVTSCLDGDGCCPSGCDSTSDDDCGSVCGNGVVETGEACDGNCPSWNDCNDGDACTTDAVVGTPSTCSATCSSVAVTACVDGDGCCAPGCTNANDDDCAATAPVALDCKNASTWPSAWVQLEDAIFAESNRRRTDPAGQTCGSTHYPAQPALKFDARLREAGRCHLLDLTENNIFSHEGTDGSRVGVRVDRTGYYWQSVGENLAAGNETASKIVDQWIASETHCKNLMKGKYEDLGVGYVFDDDTTYDDYSAQIFGTEF